MQVSSLMALELAGTATYGVVVGLTYAVVVVITGMLVTVTMVDFAGQSVTVGRQLVMVMVEVW